MHYKKKNLLVQILLFFILCIFVFTKLTLTPSIYFTDAHITVPAKFSNTATGVDLCLVEELLLLLLNRLFFLNFAYFLQHCE